MYDPTLVPLHCQQPNGSLLRNGRMRSTRHHHRGAEEGFLGGYSRCFRIAVTCLAINVN